MTLLDSLASGATLPPEWYHDPARFKAEMKVLESGWQYAGALSQVSAPGDYFTTKVGRIPVLVTRDSQGELHAMVNICRHRSSELVAGVGHGTTLQCIYHAWTYGLDGSLLAAPRSRGDAAFDRAALGLRPLQVAVWGPTVWVADADDQPSLAEFLGPVVAEFDRTGLRTDALTWRARREYPMRIDWKTGVENILECYHCPTVHPSYAGVVDLNNYHYETGPNYSVQSTVLRAQRQDAYDTAGGVTDGVYVYVWPNAMLNVNPGIGHFHVNYARPDRAGRMTMVNDFYFVPEVSVSDADDYVDFQDTVSREDIAPVESVQRGLESGAQSSGRLITSAESLIQHFQGLVATRMPEA